MLPPRFELHRPSTIESALELMARFGDDATFYAVGTELLVAMKARVLRYAHLIDLKKIGSLAEIHLNGSGGILIGALSTHHQISCNPYVTTHFPGYAALSENVANIRVRIAGTLGGNLCFAEPHADPATLLCALNARAHLVSLKGRRIINISDFILGEFSTAREDGEILTHIELPPLPHGARAVYRSFGQQERPTAGVAVVRTPHATGPEWKIWAGAVSSRPLELSLVTEAVKGVADTHVIDQIRIQSEVHAETLEIHDDAHGGADYKRHLISVLAQRAAEDCLS